MHQLSKRADRKTERRETRISLDVITTCQTSNWPRRARRLADAARGLPSVRQSARSLARRVSMRLVPPPERRWRQCRGETLTRTRRENVDISSRRKHAPAAEIRHRRRDWHVIPASPYKIIYNTKAPKMADEQVSRRRRKVERFRARRSGFSVYSRRRGIRPRRSFRACRHAITYSVAKRRGERRRDDASVSRAPRS